MVTLLILLILLMILLLVAAVIISIFGGAFIGVLLIAADITIAIKVISMLFKKRQ